HRLERNEPDVREAEGRRTALEARPHRAVADQDPDQVWVTAGLGRRLEDDLEPLLDPHVARVGHEESALEAERPAEGLAAAPERDREQRGVGPGGQQDDLAVGDPPGDDPPKRTSGRGPSGARMEAEATKDASWRVRRAGVTRRGTDAHERRTVTPLTAARAKRRPRSSARRRQAGE